MTALYLLQLQESNSLGKVGDDMEELYSISSVSPCPVEEPQPVGAIGARETSTKLPACSSQENLSNLPLHVSSLEAIRELDEAEEASSDRRSPGDGAVRAKAQLVPKESSLHSTKRETHELAFENCEEDDAPRMVIVKTVRSLTTGEDRVNYETPQTETCSSPHDGCLPEDSQRHASQNMLGSGGVHKGMLETNSTLERTIVIIGSELDDTGSSLTSLLDLKQTHTHANMGVTTGSSQLRNSTGSVTDLEENKPEDHIQDDLCTVRRDCTPAAHHSTLIDILTVCKTKVEQLEQLKCSSFELTIQLQSAQALAAHLQQQVALLEQERSSQQREVQGLHEELREAQRALQERSEEVRLLCLQREERLSTSGASEMQGAPNGRIHTLSTAPNHGAARPHTHTPSTRPDHSPSRLCTLL